MFIKFKPIKNHLKILTQFSKLKYSTITTQITLTQAFKKALISKLNKKTQSQFLRLQILAGQGCQGYTYKFKFDNNLADNDYVYTISKDGNTNHKIGFAVNQEELKLLKGATLDYAQQLMKQLFYVQQNPNAQLSCSCKTSFSPKEYML